MSAEFISENLLQMSSPPPNLFDTSTQKRSHHVARIMATQCPEVLKAKEWQGTFTLEGRHAFDTCRDNAVVTLENTVQQMPQETRQASRDCGMNLEKLHKRTIFWRSRVDILPDGYRVFAHESPQDLFEFAKYADKHTEELFQPESSPIYERCMKSFEGLWTKAAPYNLYPESSLTKSLGNYIFQAFGEEPSDEQ